MFQAFLAGMCSEIEKILEKTMPQVMEDYTKLHVLSGKEIVIMPRKMEHQGDHYTATCVGVDPSGQLRIRVNGTERLLSSEEVSIRSRVPDFARKINL
jgi:hypothetical protein